MIKKILRVKTLILQMGYVEEQSIACLILYHPHGFSSVQEALLSIRQGILDSAQEQNKVVYRLPCCLKTVGALPDAQFCAECGQVLKYDAQPVSELFAAYFKGINDGTYDTFQCLQNLGWEFDVAYAAKDMPNAVVLDSTENLLDECPNWSYRNFINNEESDESITQSHVHFINDSMQEMVFKRDT